jgi:hypothetical protein
MWPILADRLSAPTALSPCPPQWQTNTPASIQLHAVIDAALADPAHDRLAGIIDAVAPPRPASSPTKKPTGSP